MQIEQSGQVANLLAALVKAQAKIGLAAKTSKNPQFSSKYADLAEITETIRPALAEYGLGYIQKTHQHPTAALVETIIIHESGEMFSTGLLEVPAVNPKAGAGINAHVFGSALTYARRYGLAAAFGVATGDDDGNVAAQSYDRSYEAVTSQRPQPAMRQEQQQDVAKAVNPRFLRYKERIESGEVKDFVMARVTIGSDAALSEDEKTQLLSLKQLQTKATTADSEAFF